MGSLLGGNRLCIEEGTIILCHMFIKMRLLTGYDCKLEILRIAKMGQRIVFDTHLNNKNNSQVGLSFAMPNDYDVGHRFTYLVLCGPYAFSSNSVRDDEPALPASVASGTSSNFPVLQS